MKKTLTAQTGTSKYMVPNEKNTHNELNGCITSLSTDPEALLQMLINNGIVSEAEMADSMKLMKKERVEAKHKYAITEKYHKDGSFDRYATYVTDHSKPRNRRDVTATTLDALYDKLYTEYYKAYTLTRLFDNWQKYSEKNTSRKEKTIKEDLYTFNRFLKDTRIAKKDIRHLTVGDYMKYFDNLFKTKPTKSHVNSVRTLIRQLYMQAVRDGITVSSPLDMIDFKHREYTENDNDDKYYTEEERNALISYISSLKDKDVYDYAILFMFCFTMRIGELKGLQWDDISADQIYVHKQLDSENKLVDVKKARKTGHRHIYMPELALDVISHLDRQGDFVFMKNGKPLDTNTFNSVLKSRCKHAGVPYYSSHKIRFSGCTLMLENGIALYDAQKVMGHANQAMTEHYNRVRQRRADPRIKAVFDNSINNVCTTSAK